MNATVTRVQDFQTPNPFLGGHPLIERRVEFTFGGAPFVAIKTHAQRFEVYSVDQGMETFLGYVSALARTRPNLAMATIEALATPALGAVRTGGRARYNTTVLGAR